MIVTPFGMEMSFPAATVVLSTVVTKKYQSIAESLVATIVNYSINFGLSFGGNVEVYTIKGGTSIAINESRPYQNPHIAFGHEHGTLINEKILRDYQMLDMRWKPWAS
jgi:hypothetical protein